MFSIFMLSLTIRTARLLKLLLLRNGKRFKLLFSFVDVVLLSVIRCVCYVCHSFSVLEKIRFSPDVFFSLASRHRAPCLALMMNLLLPMMPWTAFGRYKVPCQDIQMSWIVVLCFSQLWFQNRGMLCSQHQNLPERSQRDLFRQHWHSVMLPEPFTPASDNQHKIGIKSMIFFWLNMKMVKTCLAVYLYNPVQHSSWITILRFPFTWTLKRFDRFSFFLLNIDSFRHINKKTLLTA